MSAFAPTAFAPRTSIALNTGAWLEEPKDSQKKSSTTEIDPRDVNPKDNFQQWIQKWEVDHRRFTTGNLLVSGNRLIDQFMGDGKTSYADPELLYMLMEEQYNFKFDKIYICTYDMDDAKKRLLSRKARYTGLLDKLEFIETDFQWDAEHPEVFNIPTAGQMKEYGITNWIMLQDYDHVWMTQKAFEVAKECDGQLKNVVMTMMDYYHDEDVTIPLINSTWDTLGGPRHRKWLEPELSDPERYQKGDVQFTFLVCGCPTDDPEGGADWVYDDLLISSEEDLRRAKEGGYDFIDGDTLKKMGYKGAFLAENWDRISQHQMMRFTVDALDLACFSGRAISFKDMWDPISKRVQKPMKSVITGMRSAGFTTVESMDHVFDKFIDLQYKWDVRRWKKKGGGRNAKMRKNWWENPAFKKTAQEREAEKMGERAIKKEAEVQAFAPMSKREKEIETIATEWAKREFYRVSTEGTVGDDMTEEKYIESVWEQAVKEGDAKWRKVQGYSDEDPSTWDDKMKQKQAVLAKQAESEIAGMMRGFDKKMDETIDATLDEYEKLVEQEKQWREENKDGDDEGADKGADDGEDKKE